ncbi:MAG: decarboxylating 6-phosphogluconate dehydrogenase [Actinomycetota bacterium]|nr:decarboxylating 6-phosphogluconate dehydrogenase [Actinomycetota bacterium]
MKLGMVGLGKMGANMTTRLLRGGHDVVTYDIDAAAVARAEAEGAISAKSLQDLVAQLDPPRPVWIMVPAGEITAVTIAELALLLDEGDIVVDGGNSRYSDSVARAAALAESGIKLLDAGTSGGLWGLEEGFCLMVGGDAAAYAEVEPAFETLAPPEGCAHVGPSGAGHFVKMVHNGVEYALMQAYAEGFELMRSGDFGIDVGRIAELWRHGSVVRSWLLDLAAGALARDPELEGVASYVEDSGEGRWTVETAIENAIPTPTIALSLMARFASRQDDPFAAKMLSALRREFGGHGVRSAGGEDPSP